MRKYFHCAVVIVALLFPLWMRSQTDDGEKALGDIARSLRKTQAPAHTVIDNDNLSQVMEEVESRRLKGGRLVFSIDDSGKGFKVSSPDVTCSLSFSAQAAPLLADQLVARDLPDAELGKLEGPASLSGDTLQVSLHNGTDWILREITVGLTIVRRETTTTIASHYPGKLVPAAQVVQAVGDDSSASTVPLPEKPQEERQPEQKRSDVTVLIHLKGAAAPLSTAVFQQNLGAALSPDQEWHWAIVKARGIPPQVAPPNNPTPAEAPQPSPDLVSPK